MIEKWMLVGLHGYGETGAELITRLVAAAPAQMPQPHWYAPNGPQPATLARGGFAWYGLTRRVDAIARHLEEQTPIVCERVRRRQRQTKLAAARTAVVGFSQGGALAAALLAEGVCSAAAAICAPLVWTAKRGRPSWHGTRLLCVAGGDEEALPDGEAHAARRLFSARAAELLELPTMGHELREDAAGRALAFVCAALERDLLEVTR